MKAASSTRPGQSMRWRSAAAASFAPGARSRPAATSISRRVSQEMAFQANVLVTEPTTARPATPAARASADSAAMMAVRLSPIASIARQAPARAGRLPPPAAVTAGGGIASCRQVLLRPGLRVVERRGEAADHLLDLVGLDDQRRAEADRVADITDDQAVMMAALEEEGAEPADRIERALGL